MTSSANPGDEHECKDCAKQRKEHSNVCTFSATNDADPFPPNKRHIVLPRPLTDIEEMVIARAFPIMKIYCLKNGQTALQGNILNVEQDVRQLFNRLPLRLSNLPAIVVRKPDGQAPQGYREFKVQRDGIREWLVFLKRHHSSYSDIVIDLDALNDLSERR
jgi:hypothetical protein